MKILHILKTFPATIKFFCENNEIFCVSTTECLGDEINLKIENPENFSVYIYPHEKEYLSYSAEITADFKTDSKLIKLYQLPEENYILKLFPLSLENKIVGNKVELDGENIKRLSFMNDIAGRARVDVFVSSENSIDKKEEYFVYVNKQQNEVDGELKLLDFFQSVLARDFSYAGNLLTANLANVLSKEKIKNFFGEYEDCCIVNYYDVPAVVLFYETEAKVFGGNVDGEKIADIYEIN